MSKEKKLRATGDKPKGGRPSIFSQKLVDEICNRIALGESLRSICDNDPEMPCRLTIFNWLAKGEEAEDKNDQFARFLDQYTRARHFQADGQADEIIDIADDGRNDWMLKETKSGNEIEVLNHEHVQRSKLRIDARFRLMEVTRPKKYGKVTRQEVSGPDGGPIQYVDAPRKESRDEWLKRQEAGGADKTPSS